MTRIIWMEGTKTVRRRKDFCLWNQSWLIDTQVINGKVANANNTTHLQGLIAFGFDWWLFAKMSRSLQIILRRQHSAGTLDVLIEGSFLNELYKILHYEYYGEHLIMKCSLEVTSILDGLKYLCSAGLSQLGKHRSNNKFQFILS